MGPDRSAKKSKKIPGFGLNLVHLGTLKVVSYSASCGEFWRWLVETYDVSAFVSGRILTYSHMAIEHPRWLMFNFSIHDIKVVVPWRETEKMEMPAANWVQWMWLQQDFWWAQGFKVWSLQGLKIFSSSSPEQPTLSVTMTQQHQTRQMIISWLLVGIFILRQPQWLKRLIWSSTFWLE